MLNKLIKTVASMDDFWDWLLTEKSINQIMTVHSRIKNGWRFWCC